MIMLVALMVIVHVSDNVECELVGIFVNELVGGGILPASVVFVASVVTTISIYLELSTHCT